MRSPRYSFALLGLLLCACGASPETVPVSVETAGAEPAVPEPGHGAALYDKWWAAQSVEFTPDDPAMPGVEDGKGGPHGDGTLDGVDGKPMLRG